MSPFVLTIGGQAGQGIKSAGLLFSKTATRSGYNIFDFTEYPSLIRGGHNMMQISFSREEVTAASKLSNFLIALNQQTIDLHAGELCEGGAILYDENSKFDLSKVNASIQKFPVPLSKLAVESGGKELLSNTVALGAVVALLCGDFSILKNLIADEFGDKGEKVISMNNMASESGYTFVKEHFADKCQQMLQPITSSAKSMIVNGNEAVVLGAIAGGLQFASIYPMSPISNMITLLAEHAEKYGYIYKQPEDEIAAITMAVGAGFAGVRSMTATSGGGFCLMTEGYGLAGITETPVVIVEGMRGGPATGLPTWSEQGDLRFILHAHQGEFPRIVLAPGDAKETFELTMKAFNLAEKYQTPVVVLIDKNICENDQSFPVFDVSSYVVDHGKISREFYKDFKRYRLSDDGVSTRSIPGTGNYFIANSDEHTEVGISTEEIDMRNAQMHKRMSKLDTCAATDMQPPILYGPQDADITFVSWGSNKGSIIQAMKEFPSVNFLHITWMNPFPAEAVKSALMKAKYLISVECNYTAQMTGLIREKTGIDILDTMLRSDGRFFYPEDITDKIKSVLKNHYKRL